MGRTSKSVVWALAAIGGVACLTACGGGKSAPQATPTVPPSSIPEGVLTYHNDLGRTGQNLDETILTPTNVNQATFGRKFGDLVDGQVYAQPLYVANLSIQGGTHNVAFVATENDTVYAFDADQPGLPLWQASVLGTGSPVLATDVGCSQISPQIGITSTPVIDLTSRTLYAVAMTKEGPSASPTFSAPSCTGHRYRGRKIRWAGGHRSDSSRNRGWGQWNQHNFRPTPAFEPARPGAVPRDDLHRVRLSLRQ